MDNLPRLGVNIDHVATIRNARGENYPSPLRAALQAQRQVRRRERPGNLPPFIQDRKCEHAN